MQHCVRLAVLDHINDQQPDQLVPDIGIRLSLPHRFQDEISRFIGVASAGFPVGHTQVP